MKKKLNYLENEEYYNDKLSNKLNPSCTEDGGRSMRSLRSRNLKKGQHRTKTVQEILGRMPEPLSILQIQSVSSMFSDDNDKKFVKE